MQISSEVLLDFDDVLIRPKRSNAPSRSAIDLERRYRFLNGSQWSGIPILAANMDATGTFEMAAALHERDMGCCLHKYYSAEELTAFFGSAKPEAVHTFYTMGIQDEDLAKFATVRAGLAKIGGMVPNLCIDVANGYTKYFVEKVESITRDVDKTQTTVMAGNVATPEMVSELLLSGAVDIVKIGIGPGSVCTTRKITGVGYPQLSAIVECADAAHGLHGHVCADGGCRMPGDVVKAFAAGADFVMVGGLLAGTDECSGEWLDDDNGEHDAFRFYGMSSHEAMARYLGGLGDYRATEGKCVTVPARGPVAGVLQQIAGGIRSACAYVGADKLKDLSKCTTFVRVNRTHNTVFGE